ncbi:MAG: DUF1579 domain-containing protein [Planctomycetes bacterium]|nr:DUF1579 domain-containing protein [Planctomycetota bacterium]
MNIARRTIEIVLVAAAAFAVGRSGVFAGPSPAVAEVKAEREQRRPREAVPEPAAQAKGAVPSRHHRHLDQLIGVWVVEYKMRSAPDATPIVFRGATTREWVLGGLFVKETVTVKSDVTGPITGFGYIGYNDLDGRYEATWLSNISSAMEFETGMYHPDNKVIHWRGETHDPVTGRIINSWSKLDMSDPNRHVHTAYSVDVDGRTFKAGEGVTERDERPR